MLALGVTLIGVGADADELEDVIEQLGHPSFVERQAASAQLRDIVDYNIASLYSYLENPELSAEQRYRVLAVAADKLINRPRGALGISMAQQGRALRQPVKIASLIDGMPASRVLKVGDCIRRIDATAIQSSEDLRGFVQSKLPGDVVLVTVDRPKVDDGGARLFDENEKMIYETVQVEMELGSVEQLDQNGTGNVNVAGVMENVLERVARTNERYGPVPVDIVISNREDLHAAIVGLTAGSTEVDQHPIIKRLLDDVRRIQLGGEEITNADHQRWQGWQTQLARQVTSTQTTPEQRDFLMNVIKRFNSLRPK